MSTESVEGDGRKPRARRKSGRKESNMSEGNSARAELLTLTIDAKTGAIVKLESVDAGGNRREITDLDKTRLARLQDGTQAPLEQLLEEAFEAGLACALDGDSQREWAPESSEDAELRRLLLAPLIDHSPAHRLMQPEVLGRAIVASLIRRSIGHASTPHRSSAH